MASTDSMHREVHPVHEELGGYEGAKMGMWLFLATELLLFGVLFGFFALFHGIYPDSFKAAHHSLDWKMGGINTLLLITSSLTVALTLDAIQRGKLKFANYLFAATIILAGGFLVVKYFEYSGKVAHGMIPFTAFGMDGVIQNMVDPYSDGHKYMPVADVVKAFAAKTPGADALHFEKGIKLFFVFYFIMTGVHGLHVVIGMTILGILMYKNMNGRYSHWYYTPVENGALYWHLVDLIWIYLFPLFYLVK